MARKYLIRPSFVLSISVLPYNVGCWVITTDCHYYSREVTQLSTDSECHTWELVCTFIPHLPNTLLLCHAIFANPTLFSTHEPKSS